MQTRILDAAYAQQKRMESASTQATRPLDKKEIAADIRKAYVEKYGEESWNQIAAQPAAGTTPPFRIDENGGKHYLDKARAVAPVETRLTELPYSPDDLQLEKAVGTIGIIALAGLPENSGFFFDAPKVRAVISEYAAQSKAPVETPGVQVIAFGTFNSGFLQHVSTTRLDAEAWARHHLADSPEVEIKRMTFYRAPEPPERKVETRLTAEQFKTWKHKTSSSNPKWSSLRRPSAIRAKRSCRSWPSKARTTPAISKLPKPRPLARTL
jgi:hypothetical protein